MQIPSYPKVWAIGHRNIADIFAYGDSVLIEEKVDGSQFSFGKIDGKLLCRSRGAVIDPDAPPELFAPAVFTALELFDNLTEGYFYRGEAICKPKHNTLTYQRVPKGNIALFDIDTGGENYLSRQQKELEVERLGLELVPLVYRGEVKDAEELLALMDTESFLGGCKIEGIVVKNYNRFGIDGKVMMGKYVSEKFKEKNQKDWEDRHPSKGDVIEKLTEALRTEARWDKAIQSLRDAGKLLGEPKDIGALIIQAKKDIAEEEGEWIQHKLYKAFGNKIISGAVKGLPEHYKAKLLESAFEEGKDERPTETPNGS